jgi:hypothetical protein
VPWDFWDGIFNGNASFSYSGLVSGAMQFVPGRAAFIGRTAVLLGDTRPGGEKASLALSRHGLQPAPGEASLLRERSNLFSQVQDPVDTDASR